MKKWIASILVMLMVCNITAVPVSAAHMSCFVDRDGDGHCDNRVECALIGMCRHQDCLSDCGGFVDDDNDGICDSRRQSAGYGHSNRTGNCGSHHGSGQRHHRRGK